MFPTMFKPRETHKFTQGYDAFHVVACRCFQVREVDEWDTNDTLKQLPRLGNLCVT